MTITIFALLLSVGIFLELYYHRNSTEITFKDATYWSIFWVAISGVFAVYLYFMESPTHSSLFVTGYLLEKVLSVDNLFVFMAIFTWFKMYFNIPTSMEHRILYWGILGAIVFRLLFVLLGTSIMNMSHWVEVVFGLVVIWTGYKMMYAEDNKGEDDFTNHFGYKIASKVFPISINVKHFFIRENGILHATPLFLCLCVIELSDILFAFDSVPAIIAVTREPLLIWTAMILAICGLRSMYFMLEAMKSYFKYLEKAVIGILFFVGFKLILNSLDMHYHIGYNISHSDSLIIIVSALGLAIVLSIFNKDTKHV